MFSYAQSTAGLDQVLKQEFEAEADFYDNPENGWAMADFVAPVFVNDGSDKGQIPWRGPEGARKEESLNHAEGHDPTRIDSADRLFRDYTLQPRSGSVVWSSKIARDIAKSGTLLEAELQQLLQDAAFKLWLEENVALVTALTTAANYDTTCTGAVTAALTSDAATFDVDIKTKKIACSALKDGVLPNALMISDISFEHAIRNAGLIAKMGDNKDKVLNPQELMYLLGLKYLRVTEARRDTGRRGDDGNQSRLLGSNAILFYKPMRVSPKALGKYEFMRTIRNAEPGVEHTVERDNKKTADKGKGAFYEEHIFKAGASSPEFINVIHPTDTVDTTCGCLLTGLY